MSLSDFRIKSLKPADKDFKISDEKGLYVLVKTTGSKYWRLKYRFSGKQKSLALGVYPEVSLKQARNKRDEARSLLAEGTDPGLHRKTIQRAEQEAHLNTFAVLAEEWFSVWKKGKNDSHIEKNRSRLERYLLPALGESPISEITPQQLLQVLRTIEKKGIIETAHRVKQLAGMVFTYAIGSGRAERNPANDITGLLQSPDENHHAAIIKPEEVGKLLLAMEGYEGGPVVYTALNLTPLLFARPIEIRSLEWEDVNWEKQRIEIPAPRMKMKQDHIIPLSQQALSLIGRLKPVTGRVRYIFPGQRGASRPLSENGVRTALRTLGYSNEQITPHGFRAMARTLLAEELEYPAEYIEMQLAHAVKDPNGRAYNRTQFIRQRTEMMQTWADYLDKLKKEYH